MAAPQRIQLQGALQMHVDELRVNLPFWVQFLNDDDFSHQGSESFVQPEVVPPVFSVIRTLWQVKLDFEMYQAIVTILPNH